MSDFRRKLSKSCSVHVWSSKSCFTSDGYGGPPPFKTGCHNVLVSLHISNYLILHIDKEYRFNGN